jgi:hypothetical protein
VEGDQENKTGQGTFSTTYDITRNLGKEQCQKAHAFAEHLAQVFQLHPPENEPEEEKALITGKILKVLPTIGIKYFTQLFNAVLL